MRLSAVRKNFMVEEGRIAVEVAYALPDRQTVIVVMMPADASIADAITRSGILVIHPEIDLQSAAVGIYGRRMPLSARPVAGDRIEIYRPLLADPKQSRLKRVRKKRNR
jgi:putative ubiquitin-RnfH superfamily antitoxin RatB of RatAB toxin-antitoxin module